MKNCIVTKYLEYRHSIINKKNRSLLTNCTPTLICSNCTGGFLYHWLGLQFRSPFINLYLTDSDFVKALEHWGEFVKYDIIEDVTSIKNYPVGISCYGIRIHFMHYKTFDEAKTKWQERVKRIDNDNIAFMLTNWGGQESVLKRFDKLSFKNKVAFSWQRYDDMKSVFFLKGYKRVRKKKNIYATQYIDGRRFIDQFDYIQFINNLR